MTLQPLLVREDWEELTRQLEREKRRLAWLIVGVVVLSAAMVGIVQRLSLSVAWDAFLGEAASLQLYLAVAVWYALRRRPEAKRVVLAVFGALSLIMAVTDYLTKAGLSLPLWQSEWANSPVLYSGVAMLLVWLVVGWLMRRYPEEVKAVGLDFSNWRLTAVYGLLGAGILSSHFFFTAAVSAPAVVLSLKPVPYTFWMLCYEVGIQSLSEEVFFRGVVFNYLHRVRHQGFWLAGAIASSLNLLMYLAKIQFTTSPLMVMGTLFYVFMAGMIYAALYWRFNSLVPSYLANVVFSMVTILR
jgi:membrane protease YdiL (CAAX protease family)